VDHLTFNLDHLRTLAHLMNRGIIQIHINDSLWIPGPPRLLARRCWQDQFMKQLAQNRAVMGQFIRDKQGACIDCGRSNLSASLGHHPIRAHQSRK